MPLQRVSNTPPMRSSLNMAAMKSAAGAMLPASAEHAAFA
jgi:hypothetical protein